MERVFAAIAEFGWRMIFLCPEFVMNIYGYKHLFCHSLQVAIGR